MTYFGMYVQHVVRQLHNCRILPYIGLHYLEPHIRLRLLRPISTILSLVFTPNTHRSHMDSIYKQQTVLAQADGYNKSAQHA